MALQDSCLAAYARQVAVLRDRYFACLDAAPRWWGRDAHIRGCNEDLQVGMRIHQDYLGRCLGRIPAVTIRETIMEVARDYLGHNIAEHGGGNRGGSVNDQYSVYGIKAPWIRRFGEAAWGGAEWCAAFAWQVATRSGLALPFPRPSDMPEGANAQWTWGYAGLWRTWAQEHGRWRDAAAYEPVAGDYFVMPADAHIGIVAGYGRGRIATIEGNIGDRLTTSNRSVREPAGYIEMSGRIRMPWEGRR